MMMLLLVISVTLQTPQYRVNETITHVTSNTMNGVVVLPMT